MAARKTSIETAREQAQEEALGDMFGTAFGEAETIESPVPSGPPGPPGPPGGPPCLLYTSPSPRDMRRSRMPSSA